MGMVAHRRAPWLHTVLALTGAAVIAPSGLANAGVSAAETQAERAIVGIWLVEDEEAQVEILSCGEALCGRIVWLEEPLDENGTARRDVNNRDPELRDRPVLGMAILERVRPTPDQNGVWRDGRIYDPKNGKTYRCNLELEADGRLKLRGYIGFSLFGRTARWTRVDEVAAQSAMQTKRTVWIDTDTSVAPGGHELDDGLALVQAFNSPELDVRGVSAVFGNAPLADTYPIAQEVVRRFGSAGLEVHEGAAASDQLGEETPATRAMAEALRRERLTLMAIGPVTNVATLLMNHAELTSQIEEVIAVAGRRPGQRFTVGDRAGARVLRDLNFELDADGFQVLLDADVPIVLAPFEISSKVLFTRDDAARFSSGPDTLQWFVQPVNDWLDLWERQFGVAGFHPFDTLAVAYLTSSEWVRCETLPVEIRNLPDDTWSGDGEAPLKPYLLVSSDVDSARDVRYCYDVAPEFRPDLVDRLIR